MTAKGRVLAIRLIEKQDRYPEYTERIGVSVTMSESKTTDIISGPVQELQDTKKARV